MFENLEIWWVTGAQMLYGEEPVRIVESHSKEMVEGINAAGVLPIKVVYKGTVMSSKDIERVMLDANGDKRCIGIITWVHTFSPSCGLTACSSSANRSSTSTHNTTPKFLGTPWTWTS